MIHSKTDECNDLVLLMKFDCEKKYFTNVLGDILFASMSFLHL